MGKLEIFQLLLLVSCVVIDLSTIVAGNIEAGYGQDCNADVPCKLTDISDPLKCHIKDGTTLGNCGCLDGMFRHLTMNHCVSYHGQNCTVMPKVGEPIRNCTERARCSASDEKCYCVRDTTYLEATGECVYVYNSTGCKKETDCDTTRHIICSENRCVCQDEKFQIYDQGECKPLVGGKCNVAEHGFPAVDCIGPNMECKDSKCICQMDFNVTANKRCGKVFNSECKVNENLNECVEPFICHFDGKRCKCPEGHEPAEENQTCQILAGKSCATDDNNHNLKCTEYATCTNGICTCDEASYKIGANGRCEGLYGATCKNGITSCVAEDFLRCDGESKCTCMNDYESDDQNKKCIGLIGQKCKSEQDQDGCISNSECKANGESFVCQCPNRFIDSMDRRQCFALYGATCGSSATCSTAHFLTCNNSQCICEEPENRLYDQISDKCVARDNKPCNPVECVEFATCENENEVNICKCNTGYRADGDGKCVEGGASSLIAGSFLFVILAVVVGKFF